MGRRQARAELRRAESESAAGDGTPGGVVTSIEGVGEAYYRAHEVPR